MPKKTKQKRRPGIRRSAVYLALAGKHLDPDRITQVLNVRPDACAKRGDLFGGVQDLQYDHGFWDLMCDKPRNAGIETKMRRILKRIAPVTKELKRLIREDGTITDATLTLDFDIPRGVVVDTHRLDAELLGDFVSLGIDVVLSIWVRELIVGEERADSTT